MRQKDFTDELLKLKSPTIANIQEGVSKWNRAFGGKHPIPYHDFLDLGQLMDLVESVPKDGTIDYLFKQLEEQTEIHAKIKIIFNKLRDYPLC